jgi:hypothetical protein
MLHPRNVLSTTEAAGVPSRNNWRPTFLIRSGVSGTDLPRLNPCRPATRVNLRCAVALKVIMPFNTTGSQPPCPSLKLIR